MSDTVTVATLTEIVRQHATGEGQLDPATMGSTDAMQELGYSVCRRLGVVLGSNGTVWCPAGFLAAAMACEGLIYCMTAAGRGGGNQRCAEAARQVLGDSGFSNWDGDDLEDLAIMQEVLTLAHAHGRG